MTGGSGPGLFGKLPSRGDFVVRRLDPACREALDDWLQACIMTSRRIMGDAWLGTYLNAPVWRFTCQAGVCGASPLAGVLMPSVDRVGRYFPLVLAAQLPDRDRPPDLATTAAAWFDALEAQALRALGSDVDLNELDHAIRAIGLPPMTTLDTPEAEAGTSQFWLPPAAGEPSVLLHAGGLPTPTSFSSLLDLHWPRGGWQPLGEHGPGPDEAQVFTLRPMALMASAGRTHAGTRRPLNQDALLMRPDLAVWAVADGVGGHEAGEVASRVVVEHLQGLLQPLGVEATLDEVQDLLEGANAALCCQAGTISDDAIVASTVAVLVLVDGHAGVVWSGDSRVYRLRAGGLDCITRDHVVTGAASWTAPDALSHAVGSDPVLVTERTVHVTWPGDRYLLCSDGLTKTLTEAEIAAHLERPTPEETVAALVDDALVGGVRDNVTVVVVHLPRP